MICRHIPSIVSDHSCLLFHLDGLGNTWVNRSKRFHYEIVWAKEPDCFNIIAKTWEAPVGHHVSCLQLLNRCASNLQIWNKSSLCSIKNSLRCKQRQLEDCQSLPPSISNLNHRLELEKDKNKLLVTEEVMWQQRSITNWLQVGDRNTKFFHSHASTTIPKLSSSS